MDSRFRAIDGRPPAYAPRPSTSNVSYLTEQALGVGYTAPNFRNTAECFRNPNSMNPMHEAVRRELEKEQIRAEIIAAKTARRQALEEEVRGEMMVEREMALHRGGGDGSAIFSGFDPRHSVLQQQYEVRSFEEGIVSAIEERFSNGGQLSIDGRFETVPFQWIAQPKITEVKLTSEVCKEKIIFVAKPEGSTSGTKHKAAFPQPVGASEPPSAGSKEKSKGEWSFALYQVSARSKQGLNELLQGEKPKSKEAGLSMQKAGKSYSIGFFRKEISKPIKLVEPSNHKDFEQLQKSIPEEVNPDSNLASVVYANDSENKNVDSEEILEKGAKRKKIQQHKDMFKFWCEMCQAGAFSEKVLNIHKKGKKHARRLKRVEGKSRAGIGAELDEATKVGPKDEDEDEDEDEEKMVNELDGCADGEV